MKTPSPWILATVGGLLLLTAIPASAATINDLVETRVWEQTLRFFSLRDPAVRYALAGTIALGLCCGVMGSFILVRKMSMLGDTLSHAVLPGVVLGFLWSGTKDAMNIFVGAVVAGLFGAVLSRWLRRSTILKEDAALGLVLGGFYGLGIVLLRLVQGGGYGNQTGLDKFLFGQAAALSADDARLMGVVALLVVGVVILFYKELQVSSFDGGFARSLGIPLALVEYLVMLLLAFSVVVALQAVGVVMVSAMLILPAATAYLLTDRFHRMLGLAACFGVMAGATGAFLSFLESGMPTGPLVVVSGTVLFAAAFLFSPGYGVLPGWWRRRSRRRLAAQENDLKAIFHVIEEEDFASPTVRFGAVVARRREDPAKVRRGLRRLERAGQVRQSGADTLTLTRTGWAGACAVIRKHRLWELYLSSAARFPADHVHEDAETIEHMLDEDTVRRLVARLNDPARDPHGRLIPRGDEPMPGDSGTENLEGGR